MEIGQPERAVPLQDREARGPETTTSEQFGVGRNGRERCLVDSWWTTAALIAKARPKEFVDSVEFGCVRAALFDDVNECGVGVGAAFEQVTLSSSKVRALLADGAPSKRREVGAGGDWP